MSTDRRFRIFPQSKTINSNKILENRNTEKKFLFTTACGFLLANSLHFNGLLAKELGSFSTVFVSHLIGFITILVLFLLLKKRVTIFKLNSFKYKDIKLMKSILILVLSSFSIVFFANKTVIELKTFLAIPVFLFFVVSTSIVASKFYYKEHVSSFFYTVIFIALISIIIFHTQISYLGLILGFLASLSVVVSRNEQRKISEKLTPFTCTLILYTILGSSGFVVLISNFESISNIVLNRPYLLIGGILGAIFQFLLAITLLKFGNLNTNTLIQLNQIDFGFLAKAYL